MLGTRRRFGDSESDVRLQSGPSCAYAGRGFGEA